MCTSYNNTILVLRKVHIKVLLGYYLYYCEDDPESVTYGREGMDISREKRSSDSRLTLQIERERA